MIDTSELVTIKENFIQAYERNACNVKASCKAVAISRQTFYNWIKTDPAFAKAEAECRDALVDVAESQLIKNILAGKEQSLFYFLDNKGKDRGYKPRSAINVETKVGVQVNNVNDTALRIKENYGEQAPAVARRLADALGIGLPSDPPAITE